MRIDGRALERSEVVEVNAVINKYWKSKETKTVYTNEGIIKESWGPDAIHLFNGGNDWIIFDRLESNAIFYHEDKTTYIACKELFRTCAKFSPLERIIWHMCQRI